VSSTIRASRDDDDNSTDVKAAFHATDTVADTRDSTRGSSRGCRCRGMRPWVGERQFAASVFTNHVQLDTTHDRRRPLLIHETNDWSSREMTGLSDGSPDTPAIYASVKSPSSCERLTPELLLQLSTSRTYLPHCRRHLTIINRGSICRFSDTHSPRQPPHPRPSPQISRVKATELRTRQQLGLTNEFYKFRKVPFTVEIFLSKVSFESTWLFRSTKHVLFF